MFSDEEATSNLAISSIEPAVFSAAPTVGFETASFVHLVSSNVTFHHACQRSSLQMEERWELIKGLKATRAVQEREVKKRAMTKS